MKLKALVVQFLKFGIVGVSNTAIAFILYYGLLYLGVHYVIAYSIGFAASVLNAYFWSSRFVFKKSGSKGKLIKSYISYGLTFLLSNGLLIVLVDFIHLSDLIAPVIVLFVTVPANFLLNKLWVFKQ